MLPTIGDPFLGTVVVATGMTAVLLASLRKRPGAPRLDEETTTELKGVAALAVIFCHVGYFLIDDHRFLFPLSAAGGVAVDVFLLLSGFGLTLGALKRDLKPWEFYRRRALKLFSPLWLALAAMLTLDLWRLGLKFPTKEIVLAFLGIVPHADLYQNINSPLWYVTLTLFLYAVFPWLFRRARPFVSVVLLASASYVWCVYAAPRVLPDVVSLYAVHRFAFPVGSLLAVLATRTQIKAAWQRLHLKTWPWWSRAAVTLLAAASAGYFVVHSGVGHGANREEGISLLTVALIIMAGFMRPWRLVALAAFGAVSYEIYLLHWPLLSRHDFLFGAWPSWAAMLAWLGLLFLAGHALRLALSGLTRLVAWRRT